jgi:hypothetical protein
VYVMTTNLIIGWGTAVSRARYFWKLFRKRMLIDSLSALRNFCFLLLLKFSSEAFRIPVNVSNYSPCHTQLLSNCLLAKTSICQVENFALCSKCNTSNSFHFEFIRQFYFVTYIFYCTTLCWLLDRVWRHVTTVTRVRMCLVFAWKIQNVFALQRNLLKNYEYQLRNVQKNSKYCYHIISKGADCMWLRAFHCLSTQRSRNCWFVCVIDAGNLE